MSGRAPQHISGKLVMFRLLLEAIDIPSWCLNRVALLVNVQLYVLEISSQTWKREAIDLLNNDLVVAVL